MNYELQVFAGSRLYGTQVEGSDTDIRGFYMPEPEVVLGLEKSKETKKGPGDDEVYWELRHFLNLALNGSVVAQEVLWTPNEYRIWSSPIGNRILGLKQAFMSRKVAGSYRGFANGCLSRIGRDWEYASNDSGTLPIRQTDPKDAMHLIRLLRTGAELLGTGVLRVRRPEDVGYFQAIRRKEVDIPSILQEAYDWEARWPELVKFSKLPLEPDYTTVRELCVDIMRHHVLA